jgi:hypothetical protein
MAIQLDHFIVPSEDRGAAARQLGTLLGVPWAEFGDAWPLVQADPLRPAA